MPQRSLDSQFESLSGSKWRLGIGLVFVLVTPGLFAFSWRDYKKNREFYSNSLPVLGQITGTAENVGTAYGKKRVTIEYEVDGRRYQLVSPYRITRGRHIGESRAIRYLKNSPEIARVDTGFEFWGTSVVSAGLGGFLFAAGISLVIHSMNRIFGGSKSQGDKCRTPTESDGGHEVVE